MRGKQDHTRERALRREQTESERILWLRLRDRRLLDFKFRRQHRIGFYYVDFVCADAGLVIELDGSQHLEQNEYDTLRTQYLQAQATECSGSGTMTSCSVWMTCSTRS